METLNIVQDVVITEPKKRGRPRKGMEKPKVVDENPKPKKLGRPLQEWRHNPDGTYNSKAIDPKYSLKYWQTHYRSLTHAEFVEELLIAVMPLKDMNYLCIVS